MHKSLSYVAKQDTLPFWKWSCLSSVGQLALPCPATSLLPQAQPVSDSRLRRNWTKVSNPENLNSALWWPFSISRPIQFSYPVLLPVVPPPFLDWKAFCLTQETGAKRTGNRGLSRCCSLTSHSHSHSTRNTDVNFKSFLFSLAFFKSLRSFWVLTFLPLFVKLPVCISCLY